VGTVYQDPSGVTYLGSDTGHAEFSENQSVYSYNSGSGIENHSTHPSVYHSNMAAPFNARSSDAAPLQLPHRRGNESEGMSFVDHGYQAVAESVDRRMQGIPVATS